MNETPSKPDLRHCGIRDVVFGTEVQVVEPCNLYECSIGDRCFVGPFTEIQGDVEVGSDCRIQSHTFICSGVTIGDGVFIGHGVMFINDLHPRSTNLDGFPQKENDWELIPTQVEDGASIGTGAVIMCGVTIGKNAMIGAGAVVTKDVLPESTVAGVPARLLRTSPQAPDLSSHE